MKFKYSAAFALLVPAVLMWGCAGAAVKKSQIHSFNINPENGLKGGTVVTVTVITGDQVKSVMGTIDIPGAYYAPFRYNADKKAWIYRDMIPMVPIPAGDYKVIIKAVTESGEIYMAEKTVRAD